MQVLSQRKDTRAEQPAREGGGVVRRGAGGELADGAEVPQGNDPLAGLRQSLDASQRVQTQLCLQRALDHSPRVAGLATAGPALQRVDLDEDDEMTANLDSVIAQREAAAGAAEPPPAGPASGAPNKTGLPDGLKAGVEQLSGLAMDDVRVHYNSARPLQLRALAYAQGADIHVGPGQEQHLPHEAWHVVQQKQGRVRPTLQLQGTAVNDDAGLEQEADRMGAQAARVTQRRPAALARKAAADSGPVQAIMSVAHLQANTPGIYKPFSGEFKPRSTVKQIDTALGDYIDAPGPGKLAALGVLNGVVNVYLGGAHEANRKLFVQQQLQPQVVNEMALINALGAANGGLAPGYVAGVGDANVPALTAVALAITQAHVALLPRLLAVSGGPANLGPLLAVAQAATPVNVPAIEDLVTLAGAANQAGLAAALAAITPVNAFLMRGLIQAAGGGNLATLAATIGAIQPANAGLLPGLVLAVGGGANLAALTAVVNAITPANAYLLPGLIPAAGGAANLGALVNLIVAVTPANASAAQTLITASGGGANLVALTGLVAAIGPANAYLLQGLLPAAGGGASLAALTALVNAITGPNAYLLQGLIPAAGGGASLAALTNIVNAITPANAHDLVALVPLAGGAGGLANLLALVQAAGAAAANLLTNMIRDAGGAGEIARLTGAINHAHPGNGLLAVDLTRVAAGNAADFQRYATALPDFLRQAAPAAAAGGAVPAAVAAYNLAGALPPNRHITVAAANMDHFLTRHTFRFFDFAKADDLNDQWPFGAGGGGGEVAAVEAELANALNAIAAAAPAANWWVEPARSRQGLVIAPYTVTVGVRSPGGANPGTAANPLLVGQFFPTAPGGGVGSFPGAAMRAILKLL